jgi:hypothetical protein
MKSNSRTSQASATENPATGFPQKRILVITLLAIGLILGLIGGYPAHDRREAPAAAATATPSRSDRNRAADLRPGQSIQWQWPDSGSTTYQIRQTMDLAPGDSEQTPESLGLTTIEGKLHVGLAAADESSVTLAMQLSDSSFTVDPTGDAPPRREPIIERMLDSHAGLLQLGRDGRVLSCRLPAALADADRAMLQGIFTTEFVLGEGSEWENEEKAQGVTFISSYRAAGNAAILKTRQARPAAEGQPSMRIVTSRTTTVPGPFWIESLEGAERIECVWMDRVVFIASSTNKMTRIGESVTPEDLVALLSSPARQAALVDGASLASADEAVRESAQERQRLARLMETYHKAIAQAKGHDATIPAMHALRDWLLANPAGAKEIAAALATPEYQDAVAGAWDLLSLRRAAISGAAFPPPGRHPARGFPRRSRAGGRAAVGGGG